MKSACQYSSSGSTFNNQQEMVAQRKVAALMSIRDYLCNNNQVALKGNLFIIQLTLASARYLCCMAKAALAKTFSTSSLPKCSLPLPRKSE